GEGAHHARNADAGSEIGRARHHCLDGLAGALGAERFDLEAVLLEDACGLAERRRLVLPIVDLADRDLERVLRGGGRRERYRERKRRDSRRQSHRFFPLDLFAFFAAPLFFLAGAVPGLGCRAAASAARTAASDLPRPSRSASRRTQYS